MTAPRSAQGYVHIFHQQDPIVFARPSLANESQAKLERCISESFFWRTEE